MYMPRIIHTVRTACAFPPQPRYVWKGDPSSKVPKEMAVKEINIEKAMKKESIPTTFSMSYKKMSTSVLTHPFLKKTRAWNTTTARSTS